MEKKYRAIKTETMGVLGSSFQRECQNTQEEIGGTVRSIRVRLEEEEGERDELVGFMVGNFGAEILKL
ncbi:unnamed protein product [Sphagnum balticum]